MTIPFDPKRIERGLYWTRAASWVEGCAKVNPWPQGLQGSACRNCWSESATAMRVKQHSPAIQKRYGPVITNGRFNGDVRFQTADLAKPLRVRKSQTYSVWNDLFNEGVTNEQIAAAFGVFAACHWHTFLICTKRIERTLEWFGWFADQEGLHFKGVGTAISFSVAAMPGARSLFDGVSLAGEFPLPNVWIGTTIEDQQRADERVPVLLQCPGRHFVSIEPMLGEIDLANAAGCTYWDDPSAGISWCILGSETGPGKRPMNLDWARRIRDVCIEANIPFFFKRDSDGNRELDGKIWSQLP